MLSGLLECGHCGHPCIVISTSSGGLYGCRGERNGTCSNARTIRRTRIEERVFAALAPALLSAGHEAAFAEAMAEEMARHRGKDRQAEIRDLEKKLRRAEKARRGILAAIEDGAPYATFRSRFEDIEAAIADLETRLSAARAEAARADTPPPDLREAFTRALRHIHERLGDPGLVHEAHTLLATLISRIRLTPDDIAPHGIAAEIETDLGRFLSADPETSRARDTDRFIAAASLLTVRHGPMARQGLAIDVSISGARVARFLDELALEFGLPEEIVLDNGPEGTSRAMFESSERTGIRLSFIEPGKPVRNACVQSFNGRFRDECLALHRFRSLRHARDEIGRWRHHYDTGRPHSALGYLSPMEFLTIAAATATETLAVSALPLNTQARPGDPSSSRP